MPFRFLCLNVSYVHEFSNVVKKKDPDRQSISEVIDSEKCAYLNA